MFRLAYFVSHPIQYQAPLLRQIAADPEIALETFFFSDFSLHAFHDRDFGTTFRWDMPLTGGYEHTVLDRWRTARPGEPDRPSVPVRGIGDALSRDRRGERRRFDAVWVHGWGHVGSWQVMAAALRRRIPILMRGEAHEPKTPLTRPRQRLRRAVLTGLFRRVAGFLSIGTLNRDFYRAYGVPPERIFPVPYAVDNAEFQRRSAAADSEVARLRGELALDPARPVILFAAKLTEVKNPLLLLAACQRLDAAWNGAGPKPYLLYVGEGTLRPALEEAVRASGLDSFRLLGFRNQSELPALYRLCNVFVLPSRFEPWGLVVNEAMSVGRTVVVSDRVGCAPDLVEDGVNGRIFPSEDAGALAEALRWALAHAGPAGEASRRRMEMWSYREDVAGLKQALQTVCRPPHSDS